MKLRKWLAVAFALTAITAFAGVASADHHVQGEAAAAANPCGGSDGDDDAAANPCGGSDDTAAANPCGGSEEPVANPCGGGDEAAANPCGGE